MRLVLFLPRRFSLAHWEQVGLFDYSCSLYRRLVDDGHEVTFVTWGGASEGAYARRLPGIRVISNRWNLPEWRYERWLHWLHWATFRRCDVIKSHQVDGADVACRTARLFGKPFIARCGYLLSDFVERGSEDDATLSRARRIEADVFGRADRVVVTTQAMGDCVRSAYAVEPERLRVIPNYVDIANFRPAADAVSERRLIFVGRLEAQKNILSLIDACRELDVELMIVGQGSLRAEAEVHARGGRARVRFFGVQSHEELAHLLRQAAIFVMPTSYEGHPKAIIEAMASGLAVLAGNVPGVNDLIEHARTGWLCATDVESIRRAIVHLLEHPDLCRALGLAARQFAVERYAFDRILDLERRVLDEVGPRLRRTPR